MKKLIVFLPILLMAVVGFAGFKVKFVKPKKPEQFQTRSVVAGVTYAADLVLEGKDQKGFFYKELTPSNVIALRLAVINSGKEQVVLPLNGVQLLGPDGKEIPMVSPETVAQAILQGLVVTANVKDQAPPVAVGPNVRVGDPRMDPTDPRYDPRLDPNDPSYDPTDPRSRRSGNRPYYGPWGRPGVDVILNPGGGQGGAGGDLSQFEKQLVEKDFSDKAHSEDPVPPSMIRDKFLYFSISSKPASARGFVLRLPQTQGIPQEVVLRF